MAVASPNEIQFIARKLVEKVWQGDQTRMGLAEQCAGIAVAAMQDYAWKQALARDGRALRGDIRMIGEDFKRAIEKLMKERGKRK